LIKPGDFLVAHDDGHNSYLLTPGPLTTSDATRHAMLRDWGSRDADFIALTARVRERLLALVNAGTDYACLPIQGSGTFAIEAAICSLVPPESSLLVAANGAYGRRFFDIANRLGRLVTLWETPEDQPLDPEALERRLAEDTSLRQVAVIHCETTSGILNPLTEIAAVCANHERSLLVDAMSSFGALPIDAQALSIEALMASSNKCLEGVPGIGFVIARTGSLRDAEGRSASLSLDLHAQWQGFEATGQWRFTPPVQVLAALDAALDQHAAKGGVAGRGARYAANCRALVEGMRALDFETLLDDAVQAPIIVTFREPADPNYNFATFYAALHARGYIIYPGKLTAAPSFRIGCIGAIDANVMTGAVEAVAGAMSELGIASAAP
jgi:2-aminoethylphosphonate-pyruvate transaminase